MKTLIVKIEIKNVEQWDVDWDDPEEAKKEIHEFESDLRYSLVNNLGVGEDVHIETTLTPKIMTPILLKDLKKNDKFMWNDTTYIVVRKYINYGKPLIAKSDTHEQKFYHEELGILKL